MIEPIAVIPYLSFQGNCEEAITAYIQAFGGKSCIFPAGQINPAKIPPS